MASAISYENAGEAPVQGSQSFQLNLKTSTEPALVSESSTGWEREPKQGGRESWNIANLLSAAPPILFGYVKVA